MAGLLAALILYTKRGGAGYDRGHPGGHCLRKSGKSWLP